MGVALEDTVVVSEHSVKRNQKIRKLVKYVSEYGFEFQGGIYFRGTWMDKDLLHALEKAEIVSKLGTMSMIKESGIKIPENLDYKSAQSAFIYRVNKDRVNNLI